MCRRSESWITEDHGIDDNFGETEIACRTAFRPAGSREQSNTQSDCAVTNLARKLGYEGAGHEPIAARFGGSAASSVAHLDVDMRECLRLRAVGC